MPSHFFHSSTAAGAINHICQASLESPIPKGQRIPNLAPNFIGSESPPTTSRATPHAIPKRYPPLIPNIAPFKTEKGHLPEEACEGPYGIRQETVWPTTIFSLGVRRKIRKTELNLTLPHCIPDKDQPRKINLSAHQWLSRSGIPIVGTIGFSHRHGSIARDYCSSR